MRICQPSRSPYLCGSALLLCCTASAQITITATAETGLSVHAGFDSQALPLGSEVAAVSLSAWDEVRGFFGHGSTYVSAYMSTALDTSDPARLRFSVSQYGDLDAEGDGPPTSFFVGGDIRLDFATPGPVSGVLLVDWAVEEPQLLSVSGNAATVDVGNDGTLEFDTSTGPPARSSIAVQMLAGTTSVMVRTDTSGFGSPESWDWASLSLGLTFVPDARCDVESFGDSCGGLTMTAMPTNLGVNYSATGLDPRGACFIALGPRLPVPVTLPFAPGCDLLVDPVFTSLHFADAEGRVRAFQDLSSPTLPRQLGISTQFGAVKANGDILTSNGVHLNCPPIWRWQPNTDSPVTSKPTHPGGSSSE